MVIRSSSVSCFPRLSSAASWLMVSGEGIECEAIAGALVLDSVLYGIVNSSASIGAKSLRG